MFAKQFPDPVYPINNDQSLKSLLFDAQGKY